MEYYPGGMAERCLAFGSQVYELPDHVTDEQATFPDPMVAALHAMDVGKPVIVPTIVGLFPKHDMLGFSRGQDHNQWRPKWSTTLRGTVTQTQGH